MDIETIKRHLATLTDDAEYINAPADIMAQLPRTLAELAPSSAPDDDRHAVRLAMHDVYRREASLQNEIDDYETRRWEAEGVVPEGFDD